MTGPLVLGCALVAALVMYRYIERRLRAGRRRAEESLRDFEARYQDLCDRAPDMMASVDAGTTRIVQCNQTLADALACSKGWMIGRRVFDLYDPGSVEDARRAFRALLDTGEVHNAEQALRRDDGARIDVSLNASAVRDADGRVVRARLVWHDITHHKAAERRLRESLVRQKDLLRRERTLRRELNHRVRNNLASILGLVGVYERAGKDACALSDAVRGKVRAMAEVHDMISGAHGLLVDLAALAERLAAFAVPPPGDAGEEGGRRVRFSGPAARSRPPRRPPSP